MPAVASPNHYLFSHMVTDYCRCTKNDLECRGYAPPKAWVFDPHAASNKSCQPASTYTSCGHVESEHHFDHRAAGTLSPRIPRSALFRHEDFDASFAGNDISSSCSYQGRLQRGQVLLPYDCSEDYHHLQYYLEKVEPSVSSVTPYQEFWGVIVPQFAWHDGAIRHLIAAMSIAHKEVIACPVANPAGEKRLTERCNLAIHDWSMQCNTQNSVPSALVLSRILSLISYVGGDFELSKNHRRHGMRIARQTLADGDSDVNSRTLAEMILQMNLCGPGFLADEDPVIKMVDETRLRQLSVHQQVSLKHLKSIRHDFEDWMFATSRRRWFQLPAEMRHVILVTWALMNRTIGSLFDPDKAPGEAGSAFGRMFQTRTRLATQLRSNSDASEDTLADVGSSPEEESLHARFKELMAEIDCYLPTGSQRQLKRIMDTTVEVQRLTDMFLVQASDILPFRYEGSPPVQGVD